MYKLCVDNIVGCIQIRPDLSRLGSKVKEGIIIGDLVASGWGWSLFKEVLGSIFFERKGFKRGGKVEGYQTGHKSRLGWLVDGSRVAN